MDRRRSSGAGQPRDQRGHKLSIGGIRAVHRLAKEDWEIMRHQALTGMATAQ